VNFISLIHSAAPSLRTLLVLVCVAAGTSYALEVQSEVPRPIYAESNVQSEILGLSEPSQSYKVVDTTESWYIVSYNNRQGAVERQYFGPPAPEKSALEFLLNPIFLASVSGLAIVISVIFLLKSMNWFPSPMRSVSKKVLIVANEQHYVRQGLTNKKTNLIRCFTEVGCSVKRYTSLDTALQALERTMPDLLVIDYALQEHIVQTVSKHLANRSSFSQISVLFYNAPLAASADHDASLLNVHYLGVSFSDKDIFQFVTPSISSTGTREFYTSVQESAFKGDIADSPLSSLFQFLESGEKTGVLEIKQFAEQHIVRFERGQICADNGAGTKNTQHYVALLDISDGTFTFTPDPSVQSGGKIISTMQVLMQWTKQKDEITEP